MTFCVVKFVVSLYNVERILYCILVFWGVIVNSNLSVYSQISKIIIKMLVCRELKKTSVLSQYKHLVKAFNSSYKTPDRKGILHDRRGLMFTMPDSQICLVAI